MKDRYDRINKELESKLSSQKGGMSRRKIKKVGGKSKDSPGEKGEGAKVKKGTKKKDII